MLGYNYQEYLKNSKVYSQRYSFFVDKLINLIPGDLLDVGAGYGFFSQKVLKESKFHVTSLEPYLGVECIDKGSRVKVVRQNFRHFVSENTKVFDVVAFLDVLEHFPNPSWVLDKAYSVTNDKGYVFIQLPNYKSLMSRLCKEWAWWMPKDHYYHFSVKSIRKLLEAHNYKVVSLHTTETFDEFKKNLDGNFESISTLLRKPIKAFTIGPFFLVYTLLQPVIHRFGMGGLIQLIAQKKMILSFVMITKKCGGCGG
ncbi:MAG: Ubiquinone biosynthesis O-methyltransferase [Microgenomates bacterium OLB22]|nr:MAG: Ubiquinone biosynthesis O-methyltransferase [Microgenomates bacterium OLB22]